MNWKISYSVLFLILHLYSLYTTYYVESQKLDWVKKTLFLSNLFFMLSTMFWVVFSIQIIFNLKKLRKCVDTIYQLSLMTSLSVGIFFWGMYSIDTKLVMAIGTENSTDTADTWNLLFVHGGCVFFLLFDLIFNKRKVVHSLLSDTFHVFLVMVVTISCQLIHIHIYGDSAYGFQRDKSFLENVIGDVFIFIFIFSMNYLVRLGLKARGKMTKIKKKVKKH